MAYAKIQERRVDDISIIALSDPATLNAISTILVEELDAAITDAARDCRAIILTSIGRAFSSGGALNEEMATGAGPEPDFGASLESHVNPLMTKLRNLKVPWIASVRGAAAGVGCSLALAADMVVASETSYFMLAFSRIGLVPDGGASHIFARSVSRVRMMEMMLLGEKLPAATALEWGLINRMVPDADLDDVALTLARRLAKGPTCALGLIRELAWSALDADWQSTLDLERNVQNVAGRTRDVAEGIAAFREKREPRFIGS